MASLARDQFVVAAAGSDLLCMRGNARNQSIQQRKVQYHAALAAGVAAWEAYLEAVVREFILAIADPLDRRFTALQQLLRDRVESELKRFNTPNSENARVLLVQSTGYDPINDWSWNARNLSGLQVRQRINEIVQLRHSFAHGYAMPSYSWNTARSGQVRLTSSSMRMVLRLFSELVRITDQQLNSHVKQVFGIDPRWY